MITTHIFNSSSLQKQLLEGCMDGDGQCQKALYDHFSSKMFAICMRYANDYHHAEDILQEGFVKVFCKLHTFRYKGSFEGWMKRVFINAAIEYYRKSLKFNQFTDIEDIDIPSEEATVSQYLAQQDLLKMIQQLPIGYRTVFNLYAIEGYNHREIGKMLNISEGTSKSQLARSRKALKKMVEKAQISNLT